MHAPSSKLKMQDFADFARTYVAKTVECLTLALAHEENLRVLESIVSSVSRSMREGGKLLLAGNGGSFADSQHLAAEFVSKIESDRVPLPAIALGTNSSAMSAIANDYGYSDVFSREIAALGRPNDTLLAISTSGNSENIYQAVKASGELGLAVYGLTGQQGGKLAQQCPSFCVPSGNTAHIQEVHIAIGHLICLAVEREVL